MRKLWDDVGNPSCCKGSCSVVGMCSVSLGMERWKIIFAKPVGLLIVSIWLLSCFLRFSWHHSPRNVVEAVRVGPRLSSYRNGAQLPARSFVHFTINPSQRTSIYAPSNVTGKISTCHLNRTNMEGRPTTAVYLFGTIGRWFSNTIGRKWFVPPMPTGKLASTLLRKKGPLQTDEETQSFFETIGVREGASLNEIGMAYEHAVDTLPEDMRKVLERKLHEYLRKEFVLAFEHMESFIKRGPQAWEEYWDPTRDAFGNLAVSEFASPEEEDQIMALRMPPQLDVTKFREYWKKNSSRFGTMLQEIYMPSRVRLTSNFGGRLARASLVMLPVMVLGLFPQYSSLSLGLQGLLASGFIFKGDRAVILEREKRSTEPIKTPAPSAQSSTSRTLVTSGVLCVHSLIGIGVSKLVGLYTSILEYLPPQLLRVACINFQFFIAALLWDTSDMTPSTYLKREEKRMSKLNNYLADLPNE